jgi:hypothetical protein
MLLAGPADDHHHAGQIANRGRIRIPHLTVRGREAFLL